MAEKIKRLPLELHIHIGSESVPTDDFKIAIHSFPASSIKWTMWRTRRKDDLLCRWKRRSVAFSWKRWRNHDSSNASWLWSRAFNSSAVTTNYVTWFRSNKSKVAELTPGAVESGESGNMRQASSKNELFQVKLAVYTHTHTQSSCRSPTYENMSRHNWSQFAIKEMEIYSGHSSGDTSRNIESFVNNTVVC